MYFRDLLLEMPVLSLIFQLSVVFVSHTLLFASVSGCTFFVLMLRSLGTKAFSRLFVFEFKDLLLQ